MDRAYGIESEHGFRLFILSQQYVFKAWCMTAQQASGDGQGVEAVLTSDQTPKRYFLDGLALDWVYIARLVTMSTH